MLNVEKGPTEVDSFRADVAYKGVARAGQLPSLLASAVCSATNLQ